MLKHQYKNFLIACFVFLMTSKLTVAQEYDSVKKEMGLTEEEMEIIENLDFLDNLELFESEEDLAFLDDYEDINDFEE